MQPGTRPREDCLLESPRSIVGMTRSGIKSWFIGIDQRSTHVRSCCTDDRTCLMIDEICPLPEIYQESWIQSYLNYGYTGDTCRWPPPLAP